MSKYRIKRVRVEEGGCEAHQDDVIDVGLSTLVSQHGSPLASPTRVDTAESFETAATYDFHTTSHISESVDNAHPPPHETPIYRPSVSHYNPRMGSHPSNHREVERSSAFHLESALDLLEEVTRTLFRERCAHWSSIRIHFCTRSIVSAFLLYNRFYHEDRLNLKDERSRTLITDYVLIMDEALACFCRTNAASAEQLVRDAYRFCQVVGHRAVDPFRPSHELVTFCRRNSRLNEVEMKRFVNQSIANRSKDTTLALLLWPLRNASTIM